jgi:hypothetical protein
MSQWIIYKDSLKIYQIYSEAADGRRTDMIVAKRTNNDLQANGQ